MVVSAIGLESVVGLEVVDWYWCLGVALVVWVVAMAVLGLWHISSLVCQWWNSEPKPEPPPPEPTRAETAKESMKEARQRYSLNCELIESAGLDGIEKEKAMLRARQNLVGQLKEVVG